MEKRIGLTHFERPFKQSHCICVARNIDSYCNRLNHSHKLGIDTHKNICSLSLKRIDLKRKSKEESLFEKL